MKNVRITPPKRLPTASLIYTNPMECAFLPSLPSRSLHPVGKISPIIKLKGSMRMKVLIMRERRLMNSPGGMRSIFRINLIQEIWMKGSRLVMMRKIEKLQQLIFLFLLIFPPTVAPRAIPMSQQVRIIPRQSSLPKNTTINSLMKIT